MKSKTHYVLVRATFSQAVSPAAAMRELKNLAALSYERHYPDTFDGTFRLAAVKRAAAPVKQGRRMGPLVVTAVADSIKPGDIITGVRHASVRQ